MANREWGAICPECQGLLLEREEWTKMGVVWCSNEDAHGGNGRFWRSQEVAEGWYDPNKVGTPTEAHLQRQARAEQAREAADAIRESKTKRIKETRRMTDSDKPAKAPKAPKEPTNCMCGCGGQTKGGRFLPGHDARYHARMRTLENEPHNLEHGAASKIASAGPLTGKYAVQPKPVVVKPPKPAKAPKAPKAQPVDDTDNTDGVDPDGHDYEDIPIG